MLILPHKGKIMTELEKIKMLIEQFDSNFPKLSKKNTLNQVGASEFIGCSCNTIKNYRDDKVGPRYSQPGGEGGRVFYLKTELAIWLVSTSMQTA